MLVDQGWIEIKGLLDWVRWNQAECKGPLELSNQSCDLQSSKEEEITWDINGSLSSTTTTSSGTSFLLPSLWVGDPWPQRLSQTYSDWSRTCHEGKNKMLGLAGRLTTCLLHVGWTSDWHECETKVEQSPRWVWRVEGEVDGSPREFRRVRGREGLKSKAGVQSAQGMWWSQGKHRSWVARNSKSNIKSKDILYTGVVFIY